MSLSSSNPDGREPKVDPDVDVSLGRRSKLKLILMTLAVAAWAFIGFMIAQAICLALILLLKWLGVPVDSIGETVFSTIANIFVYGLTLVIIIGLPLWVKKIKTPLNVLGLDRALKGLDFAWLAGGAVTYLIGTMVLTGLMMYFFPSIDYDQAQDTGFKVLGGGWEFALAFISLVVIAPVSEEIIFRGYLFGKLRQYSPTWVAVLITAGLFALAHGQINVGIDTFALGTVLCLLRIYSGSLWAPIMLHALKNAVAFYILFVNPVFL